MWNISLFIPLMQGLPEEFMKHKPISPVLKTCWTQILLLSFFRPPDEDYLCALHVDSENDRFLKSLVSFHILHSQQRNGELWRGGIPVAPTSLSKELSQQPVPTGSDELKEFYGYYNKLIQGEWENQVGQVCIIFRCKHVSYEISIHSKFTDTTFSHTSF